MEIQTQPYLQQNTTWPISGQHILAQYDHETIIVYQAYNHRIAEFALSHGRFGGEFKMSRMTWIKPNFLWMMYRSGWAGKPNQEKILAIHLKRSAFEELLSQAVHTTYDPLKYESHADWKSALAKSDVRLQWDPDHDPIGKPVARRAVQIGIKGKALRFFNEVGIVKIEDMTAFVQKQRLYAQPADYKSLHLPIEQVYPVNPLLAKQIGVDHS